MYSNQTFNNPSFLKRFSHNYRFNLSLDLIFPKDNDTILDFGTGDGHILNKLYERNKNCVITGYEPLENSELSQNFNNNININIVNNLNNINTTFNKISCFEVLEHLSPENQEKELLNIKSLLKDNGTIIISVPIESGLSSLFKNITRVLQKQEHQNTNFKTIIKSLFSIPINRGNDSYINSHIGFYYNNLEVIFKKVGLDIEKKVFSPIKILGSLFNSQVFYILKK